MNKIEAVIFDMDGVIIDSEPVHYTINKKLYKNLNIDVTDEVYQTFIGKSMKQHYDYLYENCGLTLSSDEFIRLKKEYSNNHLLTNNYPLIEGVDDLLKNLKDNKIKLAIASSSSMDKIQYVVDFFNLKEYFLKYNSGDSFNESKPHPEIYLNTAKALDVDPSKCIVIEDSYNGILAAKAAGMTCIALKHKTFKQDTSHADYTVDSLVDAMKIINSYL